MFLIPLSPCYTVISVRPTLQSLCWVPYIRFIQKTSRCTVARQRFYSILSHLHRTCQRAMSILLWTMWHNCLCSLYFFKNHLTHNLVDISIYTERKQRDFQKDLRDLEKSIYPEYEEIAKNITIQKADLDKNSNKLSVAINKHRNDLHRKIDAIIRKKIFDQNEMDSKYLAVFNKKNMMKSLAPFLKSHITLLNWRNYWSVMIVTLSLPINPGMLNSVDCPQNFNLIH